MLSKDDELYAFEGITELSYFRKLLVGSLATIHNRLTYPVVSKNGIVIEKVPISIGVGSKQWVIDKHELKDFKDCDPKKLNGSVDKIPNGVMTPTEFGLVPDEALNDNIRVIQDTHFTDSGTKSTTNTRVKFVPISISFTLKIRASSMSQAFLISESLIEMFDDTMEFRYSHFGLDKLVAQVQKQEGMVAQRNIPLQLIDSSGYVDMEFTFICMSGYPKLNRYIRYDELIKSGKVNVNPK